MRCHGVRFRCAKVLPCAAANESGAYWRMFCGHAWEEVMKFGVTIPNNWGIEDPQHVLALGPVAEELGYDSLWVMDHLFNNGYIRERLDDKPYYHPLVTLSYLSATTRRIMLGTSVLDLPYQYPRELAKYTATLDQMSGGRLTLGLGAG